MTATPPVSHAPAHHHDPADAPGTVQDPVCGTSVDPAAVRRRADYAGHRYFFCSAECRDKFTGEPARYIPSAHAGAPGTAARTTDGEVLWTCPMHPQIVRKEPGSCPICGMTLEPMTPTAGDTASPELRNMTRRFWAGVALSLPLLAMAMADHFNRPALDALLSPRLAVWVQLIPGTPAVLWGGWPFFQRGWASIVNRRLNMFTLIALGTGVAYLYSLVAALMPGHFSRLVPRSRRAGAALLRGGGRHRHTGSARPGPRTARPFPDEQRNPGASRSGAQDAPGGCARMAATRTSLSKMSSPAIACAYARARKCRSTASCSRATARSMNR